MIELKKTSDPYKDPKEPGKTRCSIDLSLEDMKYINAAVVKYMEFGDPNDPTQNKVLNNIHESLLRIAQEIKEDL